MTVYAVQARPVVADTIVGLGILVFVTSMIEVLLDLAFPPHRRPNY